MKKISDDLMKDAIELAEKWQNRANELLTSGEKNFQSQMAALLEHPIDKVTLTRLIRVFVPKTTIGWQTRWFIYWGQTILPIFLLSGKKEWLICF